MSMITSRWRLSFHSPNFLIGIHLNNLDYSMFLLLKKKIHEYINYSWILNENKLSEIISLWNETGLKGYDESIPLLKQIMKYLRHQMIDLPVGGYLRILHLCDALMRNCGIRAHVLIGRYKFLKTIAQLAILIKKEKPLEPLYQEASSYAFYCLDEWSFSLRERNDLFPFYPMILDQLKEASPSFITETTTRDTFRRTSLELGPISLDEAYRLNSPPSDPHRQQSSSANSNTNHTNNRNSLSSAGTANLFNNHHSYGDYSSAMNSDNVSITTLIFRPINDDDDQQQHQATEELIRSSSSSALPPLTSAPSYLELRIDSADGLATSCDINDNDMYNILRNIRPEEQDEEEEEKENLKTSSNLNLLVEMKGSVYDDDNDVIIDDRDINRSGKKIETPEKNNNQEMKEMDNSMKSDIQIFDSIHATTDTPSSSSYVSPTKTLSAVKSYRHLFETLSRSSSAKAKSSPYSSAPNSQKTPSFCEYNSNVDIKFYGNQRVVTSGKKSSKQSFSDLINEASDVSKVAV
jgi:hypothetical protein